MNSLPKTISEAGSSSEPSSLISSDERGAAPRPATNLPRVDTVEQALAIIGSKIGDEKFSGEIRNILRTGRDVKYSLLIKAADKGFVVNLGFRQALPNRNLFTFAKLTILFLLFAFSAVHAAEVGFTWSPNREPDVAGYRLYWGPSSGQYTNMTAISGGAVSSNSLESPLTAELIYRPLYLVTDRSIDGMLWQSAITNEVSPLKPIEFFRVRITP